MWLSSERLFNSLVIKLSALVRLCRQYSRILEQNNNKQQTTGGTATALTKGGVKVTTVSDITSFPEILGGRVKTLHPHVIFFPGLIVLFLSHFSPQIHGGILAKRNEEHLKELQSHNIAPIDLGFLLSPFLLAIFFLTLVTVVCNLYPFVEVPSLPAFRPFFNFIDSFSNFHFQTIAKEGITEDEAIEQIDIGGVTLLRAAAKNNKYVLSVSDPKDYASLAEGFFISFFSLFLFIIDFSLSALFSFSPAFSFEEF